MNENGIKVNRKKAFISNELGSKKFFMIKVFQVKHGQ